MVCNVLCDGVVAQLIETYLNVRIPSELRSVLNDIKVSKKWANNKSRKLLKLQHI